jgi:hypothetical protein
VPRQVACLQGDLGRFDLYHGGDTGVWRRDRVVCSDFGGRGLRGYIQDGGSPEFEFEMNTETDSNSGINRDAAF